MSMLSIPDMVFCRKTQSLPSNVNLQYHFYRSQVRYDSQNGRQSQSRETMEQAKVPIIPGSEGSIENETDALKVARKLDSRYH